MTRPSSLVPALLLAVFCSACAAPSAPASDAPFAPLLSPGSLDGWTCSDRAWSWQDAGLIGDAARGRGGSELVRAEGLADFELRLEFKVERNGGWRVQLFATDPDARGLWLTFEDDGIATVMPIASESELKALAQPSWSGARIARSIEKRAVVRRDVYRADEWTSLRLISYGRDTLIFVDDQPFASWSDDRPSGQCKLHFGVEEGARVALREVVYRSL